MTRRRRQEIERFKICPRCNGKDTADNGIFDDEYYMKFYGWCFDCDHGYVYSTRIDTVEDRKGRL